MGHKDLRLGKIVYIFVFHNISLSWLLPLESLYTDVYLSFLLVLFENIGELSERATTSAERGKNTTPLHWRSINTLRFIFYHPRRTDFEENSRVPPPPPLGITMDKERNHLNAGLRERLQ